MENNVVTFHTYTKPFLYFYHTKPARGKWYKKIKIIKLTRVEVQMLPNFSSLYKQVGRASVLLKFVRQSCRCRFYQSSPAMLLFY